MKQPVGHQTVRRRKLLEIALLGAGVLAMGAAQLPSFANATSSAGDSSILIDALRSIGKDVCIAAADKLESAQTADEPFSLHLRNAELQASDAEILAKALVKLSSDNGQMLRSFSVSYNPLLGDKGTEVLVQSLPQTVSEIGFVGCEIGDVGGKALLRWARQAPRLGVICVENNRFSEETKALFRELSNEKVGLLVVV